MGMLISDNGYFEKKVDHKYITNLLPNFNKEDIIACILKKEFNDFDDLIEVKLKNSDDYKKVSDIIKQDPNNIKNIITAFSNLSDENMLQLITLAPTIGICLHELGLITKEKYPLSFNLISPYNGTIFFMRVNDKCAVKNISIRDLINVFKLVDIIRELTKETPM